jgi:CheY-like chemotaxis protein
MTSLDSKPDGKTILIVDDESGVLEVLEYILTDLGYSVALAVNGRDAFVRIGEKVPDLILLDYMMPVMDGGAVLKALKENIQYRDIPVVLTSALSEQNIKAVCGGYDAFLRKPYRFEQLLGAINRALDHKSEMDKKPARD